MYKVARVAVRLLVTTAAGYGVVNQKLDATQCAVNMGEFSLGAKTWHPTDLYPLSPLGCIAYVCETK